MYTAFSVYDTLGACLRAASAAVSPLLCVTRTLAGVNGSSSASVGTNLGFLVGVGVLIAVGAGILSTISNGRSSAVPSIKETQQELGKFLH